MNLLDELKLAATGDGAAAVMTEVLNRLDRGRALQRLELAHGTAIPPAGATGTGTPRIVICLAGENVMCIPAGHDETRRIVLRPFEAVFVCRDSWNHPLHEKPHTFVTLDFNPAHIRYYFHERAGVVGERRQRLMYLRKGSLPPPIIHALHALEALQPTECEQWSDASWGLAASLIAQLDDALTCEPSASVVTPEGKWEIVKQYIDDYLHEPLTREDVAQSIDVHPNHLSRLVRRFSGISYVGYLNERRLSRAAEWITKYDMPACEVGKRCGYPDPTHFSRSFKSRYGLPPKAYRENASGLRAE